MTDEDELFMRCIQLDIERYELQDTIQEILDFLYKTHITIEEFKEVQRIANREEKENKNEQKLCR